MIFDDIAVVAGCLALLLLAVLLLANTVIIVARLSHNPDLANRIARALAPLAGYLRLGGYEIAPSKKGPARRHA